MIHLIKEGDYIKSGLNIVFGIGWRAFPYYPWIAFKYRKNNIEKYTSTIYVIRIRTGLKPYIIKYSNTFNIIDDYLFSRGEVIIPREVYEDYVPKIIKERINESKRV